MSVNAYLRSHPRCGLVFGNTPVHLQLLSHTPYSWSSRREEQIAVFCAYGRYMLEYHRLRAWVKVCFEREEGVIAFAQDLLNLIREKKLVEKTPFLQLIYFIIWLFIYLLSKGRENRKQYKHAGVTCSRQKQHCCLYLTTGIVPSKQNMMQAWLCKWYITHVVTNHQETPWSWVSPIVPHHLEEMTEDCPQSLWHGHRLPAQKPPTSHSFTQLVWCRCIPSWGSLAAKHHYQTPPHILLSGRYGHTKKIKKK